MLFEITAEEISNLAPAAFVDFMNHLSAAECERLGIPPTQLHLNSDTTSGEGGVDGRIEDSGHLGDARWVPQGTSCWQFKTDRSTKNATPSKMAEEVRKPRVREVLKAGGHYRVAIGRVFDDRMRKSREKAIRIAIKGQRGTAVGRLKILTANDLARWASEHASLLAFPSLRRPLGRLMRVDQWERDERHLGSFVPDEARHRIIEEVRRFAGVHGSPVHKRLLGRSGIGKTRLVLEAFKLPGFRERVLYAADPSDIPAELWAWLREHTTTGAALVIDECTESEADRLKVQADACEGRVRLVTIGIGEPFLSGLAPNHVFLERLGDEEIRKAINARVSTLTYDQRAWITRLRAGYVKLAIACADAIARKPEIDVAQLTNSPEIRQVLTILLPNPVEHKVMRGLSLLSRVGFEGDAATEGPRGESLARSAARKA